MNRQLCSWLIGAPILTVTLAGGGAHAQTVRVAHHTSTAHSKPSPSPSSTTAPSSSTPPTVSTSLSNSPSPSQSVPVSNNPNPQPILSTPPYGGGIGATTGLRPTVTNITAEGQITVNGTLYNVYLINMSLKNITTSVIPFALDDVIVAPTGSSVTHSRNDYSLSGVTQENSLFPYPLVPSHAEAVVTLINSNTSVSGYFTAEVPIANQYAVHISGNASAIATFSH